MGNAYIGTTTFHGAYMNDEDLLLCSHVENDTTDNGKG
jgi:hypothetical protein